MPNGRGPNVSIGSRPVVTRTSTVPRGRKKRGTLEMPMNKLQVLVPASICIAFIGAFGFQVSLVHGFSMAQISILVVGSIVSA